MLVHKLVLKRFFTIYWSTAYFFLASLLVNFVKSDDTPLTFLYKSKEDQSLVDLVPEYGKLGVLDLPGKVADIPSITIPRKATVWLTLLELIKKLDLPEGLTPLDLDFTVIPSHPSPTSLLTSTFSGRLQRDFQVRYYLNKDAKILVSPKKGPKNHNMTIKLTRDGETLLEKENFTIYEDTNVEELWTYLVNEVNDKRVDPTFNFTLEWREKNGTEIKKKTYTPEGSYSQWDLNKETIKNLKATELTISLPRKKCYFYTYRDGELITHEEGKKFSTMQKFAWPKKDINHSFQCMKEIEVVQGELMWPAFNQIASELEIPLTSIKVVPSWPNNPDEDITNSNRPGIDTTKFRLQNLNHFMLMKREGSYATVACKLKKEGSDTVINELDVPIYPYNSFKEVYFHLLHQAGYEVNEKSEPGMVTYEKIDGGTVSKEVDTKWIYVPHLAIERYKYPIKDNECTFIMPADTELQLATETPSSPTNNHQNDEDSHFKKWWPCYLIIGLVILVTGFTVYTIWKQKEKKIKTKSIKLPN